MIITRIFSVETTKEGLLIKFDSSQGKGSMTIEDCTEEIPPNITHAAMLTKVQAWFDEMIPIEGHA